MATGMAGLTAMSDLGLGLGDMLSDQRDAQTEEEQRKKRLGLSTMGGNPLNFGMTGVASADLGMPSVRRA